MIDHALHTRLASFADGRRVRHSFAARTGPPISVGVAMMLLSVPLGYWARSTTSTIVGVGVTLGLLVGGLVVLSRVRSYVIMATDSELLVLRSHLLMPGRPIDEVDRFTPIEADLTVRTSPWGFAQAQLDGRAYEVVSRDYTNAHAMGQAFGTGGGTPFSDDLSKSAA